MAQTNWEADKMLDVYIYDYLVKRELKASAQAFQAEAKVSSDPVAIDAPGGFLFEWWSVFWDIFIARTNEKHSEVAASYIETQLLKARDQQQQQQQPQQSQPPQQMQMQQLLLQRYAQQQQQQQQQSHQQQQQQQRREGIGPHHLNGPTNALIGTDPLMRHNSSVVSAMAAKAYEEKMKLTQRDASEDASMKRFGENAGQLMDLTQTSMMKSGGPSSQTSGQLLHGAAGSMSPQVQVRGQQQPGPPDLKNDLNPVLNPRAVGPDGSLIGVPGANQGNNNLTLKGWPLTGLDQLRSGLLQQKNPFIQSPQPFHQLQMLTPQHQQQLPLAQQNLTNPSANDLESRRLSMLLNSRNMTLRKDSLSNSIGDVIPNMCSTMQVNGAVLPRGDPDMQLKLKMAQLHQQQQQNNHQQYSHANQMLQNINHNLHQQEKLGGPGSGAPADGALTSSYRANEQTSKSQTGRKRKQHSFGPANSTGTANTAGPSPSSAPSTPSNHMPGDVMSIPALPHITSSSKLFMMFGTDGPGALTSPSNQLWDDKDLEMQADMDRFAEDAALDNVESFLAHDDTDPRDAVGLGMDVIKGFSFNEVCSIRASTGKVTCCHFSSDGKLLASGSHDKNAVLWHTDNLKTGGMKLKATLEEHSSLITDVRFSPSVSRLATSSYDKTVRVWDADNAGYSLRNFSGHSGPVMSLDFHPNKDDLIASCDRDGETRYWSIKDGSCVRVFKGGMTQIRFRPRNGRLLAAAAENIVSVLDVETQAILHSLQGHEEQIHSVCWSPSGNLLASVSNDSVRVWNINDDGECAHELSSNGNQFHSCVFHPTYPSLLVVGCFQSLELWNMTENKTMTLSAHEGVIASLAMSTATGLVASASHDKMVKLWK